MRFNTIEEIKSYFNFANLEGSDKKSISKKLKKIIRDNHPDKNGGEFKDDKGEQLFHDAQSALEFLSQQDKIILSPANIDNLSLVLSQVLKDISLRNQENNSSIIVNKTEETLGDKIQQSITAYHNKHSTPKITSIAIAAVLTGLWVFPNAIKDNPLLSQLSGHYKELTVLWIFSLIFSGALWLKTTELEKRDEQIKNSYKLESTQNKIFKLFILRTHIIAEQYSFDGDIMSINFNKEMLMNFLVRRFTYFEDMFHHFGPIDIWSHKDEISSIERSYRDYSDRIHDQRTPFSFLVHGNFYLPLEK